MKKKNLKTLKVTRNKISNLNAEEINGAENPLTDAAAAVVIRVAYHATNCNTCGNHLGQDTCMICGLTDHRTGELCSLPTFHG